MKIQVTGSGKVLHGIGVGENATVLEIPPGIHVTSDEDPSSMITLPLAKYLIATTNGHVIEYVAPPPNAPLMVTVADQKSEKRARQDEYEAAQAAQDERMAKAAVDREADKQADIARRASGKR